MDKPVKLKGTKFVAHFHKKAWRRIRIAANHSRLNREYLEWMWSWIRENSSPVPLTYAQWLHPQMRQRFNHG